MSISFHDVERLQALYPENQIELREGKLIMKKPSYKKQRFRMMTS